MHAWSSSLLIHLSYFSQARVLFISWSRSLLFYGLNHAIMCFAYSYSHGWHWYNSKSYAYPAVLFVPAVLIPARPSFPSNNRKIFMCISSSVHKFAIWIVSTYRTLFFDGKNKKERMGICSFLDLPYFCQLCRPDKVTSTISLLWWKPCTQSNLKSLLNLPAAMVCPPRCPGRIWNVVVCCGEESGASDRPRRNVMTDVYNQNLLLFPVPFSHCYEIQIISWKSSTRRNWQSTAQLVPVYAIAIRIWSPRRSDDIPATRATTPADLS